MTDTEFTFVRSLGYFGDDATRDFRSREKDRLADLCGPEIGKIMWKVGWKYTHGAHAVVTARDRSAKVQAIGWAIQTDKGINLSYAVAKRAEGNGLGRLVTSMAIVEADRQYGGLSNPHHLAHAQWREDNYASGVLAQRLGLQMDTGLSFTADLDAGATRFVGGSMPATSAVSVARRYLAANGNPELLPIYGHARFAPAWLVGYEVSSQGDKRFSALNARLRDGRTIEEAYQLDVKGYRAYSSDWRAGKGKPALNPATDLWAEYKALWLTWAAENPLAMAELADKAKGKCLTDRFASSAISQARALAEILNERHEPIHLELELEGESIPSDQRETSFAPI